MSSRFRRLLAFALTALVMVALLLIWRELNQRHEQNLRGQFKLETQRLTTKIDERMASYAQILRAGAGVFAASEQVSRPEWQRFVEKLDLQLAYRGIQGVGFTQYIPREQLARHIQAIRSEGFPDYQVRPTDDRPEYSSIIYLEPFTERNLLAFGYDMFSEPVRHAAMVLARDSGRVAFSGKVKLVQETHEKFQAGFLAYHAVYRGGRLPLTIEQRRAELLGWVYSPYRANDLLDPILQNELGHIRVEIFDGDTSDAAALLYDSADSLGGSSAPGVFTQITQLQLEGRRWTLRYTALPSFVSDTKFEPPWVEISTVGIIALLLLGITWAFFNTREQAERIAAQLTESLRASEEKLRRLLNEMPVGLCLVDNAGTIYFRNIRFIELFGYDETDVPTLKVWWEKAYPDSAYRQTVLDTWNAAVERAASTASDIDAIEYRVTSKNGDVHDILISGITFDSSFLATFVDQTERRQREEELRQARIDAEAASRAKSAFVANMSHEIRTPMNAVLGLLQLLQHTELTQQQLDYVQKAQGAAQSLLAILNDILDFSKVEAGKLLLENTPFRLDELLRNLSVVLSSALHSKEVEVLFQLDQGIPRALRGDALRLQQVLLNLAGNAIKFTERGEVVIGLHLLESTPTSTHIEFSVRDTGIGIPADRMAAVFEGFAQAETSTTRRFGGTGLGLPISQRLVRLMGGELAVESTVGQGSCFYFTLEFARDEETLATEREAQRAVSPAALPHMVRVLIVDDNAIARDVLKNMAASFGWQVETAASGAEALALVEREHAADHPFDVVCVDWIMPGMDGWETMQQIHVSQREAHTPAILMITAHGRELMAERLAAGVEQLDGFLVKPVTPSMLFDAVAQATGGKSVAVERRAAARHHDSRRLAGLRLLLVEDNPLNQQVAQELLAHAGAQVEVANNGREGIAFVKAAQIPFDAVLMDIQMPEMDGYQATRILRQEIGAKLPIIAMTANALPADREACLAAGMDDHVGKPINIAELIATVLRHCGGEANPAEGTRPDSGDLSLPAVPAGFDLPAAVARLGGNRTLFASLARRFDDDQEAIMTRSAEALRQGDTAAAARELHTLKGLAATLGAPALASLAAEIETRLKDGITLTEDGEAFARLRDTLAETVRVLHHVADTFDPAETVASGAGADAKRAIELLKELEDLLASNNMRALDVHNQLKQEAGALLGEQATTLAGAIDALDFSAARQIVVSLREQMKS